MGRTIGFLGFCGSCTGVLVRKGVILIALVTTRWDGNCDGRLAGMSDGCDNAGVYGLMFVGSMHWFIVEVEERRV